MARAMNVEKRIEALCDLQTKIEGYATKSAQIAQELTETFSGDKTPEGKQALKTAKMASKFSSVLFKAAGTVTFLPQ